MRGKNNTTGVALIEAYDLSKLVGITLTNISTRGFVDVGQNVMIGGFISGNGIVRVIIRALGPTLTAFNVPNVLGDPMLDVRDANGVSIATNDDWKSTQQAEIQASGFAPPNDKEPAVVITRPSTNTTAIVAGKTGAPERARRSLSNPVSKCGSERVAPGAELGAFCVRGAANIGPVRHAVDRFSFTV